MKKTFFKVFNFQNFVSLYMWGSLEVYVFKRFLYIWHIFSLWDQDLFYRVKKDYLEATHRFSNSEEEILSPADLSVPLKYDIVRDWKTLSVEFMETSTRVLCAAGYARTNLKQEQERLPAVDIGW